MSYLELFGILSTIVLVISMTYNCKTKKSMIAMRSLNALAAVMFIIYSCMLCAYSTIVSNVAILIIDIFYLYKLLKSNN